MSKRVSWETLEEILRRNDMYNIEDHKVVKDLRKEVVRLNTKIQVMKDVELEEIERLKKEKEWWKKSVESYVKADTTKAVVVKEIMEEFEKMMQQALKVEGEMKKKIKRLTITSFDMLQLKKWHKLRHKNKH